MTSLLQSQWDCPSVFALGNEIAWNKDGQHAVLQMLVNWYSHHFLPVTVPALMDVLSCSATYRISRKAVQSMRGKNVWWSRIVQAKQWYLLEGWHAWADHTSGLVVGTARKPVTCNTYVRTAMVSLRILCSQFGPVLANWFLHFIMQEMGAE